jgi:hypothetical protein
MELEECVPTANLKAWENNIPPSNLQQGKHNDDIAIQNDTAGQQKLWRCAMGRISGREPVQLR